jgi:Chlamydia-phage Chp2 scaffold (Chlamy_scaf)
MKNQIKYRQHNNYDIEQASDEATITDNSPSLTIQAQAEDADINVLMRRYGITGKMPENVKIPTYGDFTHVTDYRSAVEATKRAHENFMEIPADIRAKFHNDPQIFMEFADDPNNIEHMVSLGLAKFRPPEPDKDMTIKELAEQLKQGGQTQPTTKHT